MDTLWLFNMEHVPFIVDFPSYKPPFIRDLYHGYVSHNQMVYELPVCLKRFYG